MRSLARYFRGIWIYFVILAATFWLVAWLVPSRIIIEIEDNALIVMSIMVLALYAPIAWKGLKAERADAIDRLLLGIVLAWTANLVLRSLAIMGRSFGRQAWIVESPFFAFVLWGLIWGAALHLAAPSADNPTIHLPYMRWTLTVVVVGGLLAAFFLGVQAGLFWLQVNPLIKPLTG